MSEVAIVQLCRHGDIVSILPVAKYLKDQGNNVTLITHPHFASILKATSYVKTVPFHGTHRNVAGAVVDAKRFKFTDENILVAQVDGNLIRPPRHTRNFITEQWARVGMLDKFHELPLVFDRRDKKEEQQVLDKHLPPDDGRPLLAYNLNSFSSPYPYVTEQREWINQTFGGGWRLLDLSDLKLPNPVLLLPLLEKATALLTVDTLTLHLSYATGTPIIAMSAGKTPKGEVSSYYDSEPRKHWISQLTYDVSVTEEARNQMQRLLEARDFEPGRLIKPMPAATHDPVYHVVDWYLGIPEDNTRILRAWESWNQIQKRDRAYTLLLHTVQQGQRTSRDIGDSKGLPYINDIIDFGAVQARGDDPIIVFTNSDVCLCPQAIEEIRWKLADQPCCYSRRVDVASGKMERMLTDLEKLPAHVGADLFAFRVSFWSMYSNELPKLFLSYEGWDWVARRWCEMHAPAPEMKPPVIWHEKHNSYWASGAVIAANPAQLHNRAECEKWARDHGMADAMYTPRQSQFLFKPDHEWQRKVVAV